jgi:hypothetical protein
MMEAVNSFDTSITKHLIPEDYILDSHHREKVSNVVLLWTQLGSISPLSKLGGFPIFNTGNDS